MSIRQTACIYFALQGIAVVFWWLLLFFVPASRAYFRMGNDSEAVLLAFWLPDLLLLVAAGSLVTSGLCYFNSELTAVSAWFTFGAVGYATFYCLAYALLTDRAGSASP